MEKPFGRHVCETIFSCLIYNFRFFVFFYSKMLWKSEYEWPKIVYRLHLQYKLVASNSDPDLLAPSKHSINKQQNK